MIGALSKLSTYPTPYPSYPNHRQLNYIGGWGEANKPASKAAISFSGWKGSSGSPCICTHRATPSTNQLPSLLTHGHPTLPSRGTAPPSLPTLESHSPTLHPYSPYYSIGPQSHCPTLPTTRLPTTIEVGRTDTDTDRNRDTRSGGTLHLHAPGYPLHSHPPTIEVGQILEIEIDDQPDN